MVHWTMNINQPGPKGRPSILGSNQSSLESSAVLRTSCYFQKAFSGLLRNNKRKTRQWKKEKGFYLFVLPFHSVSLQSLKNIL